VIARYIPAAHQLAERISNSRFVPTLATFVAAYLMFFTLMPSKYRAWRYPKWPGAALTCLWWYASVTLLPRAVSQFGGYTLTYGGLAGVMVALLFFWLIGYGLVVGAHVNAALANPDPPGLKGRPIDDDMMEAKWLDI